jgi:hypothetical protein
MAKAKKTTPTPEDATTAAAAAKKKTLPKPKAKPSDGPAVSPLVDTTLVAQSAARGLVAGLSPISGAYVSGKESASFKQLKDSLAHPAAAGLDSVLEKTAHPSSRKSNAPFAGPRAGGSGGRNQTFGADVNRSGVPRRTSGG